MLPSQREAEALDLKHHYSLNQQAIWMKKWGWNMWYSDSYLVEKLEVMCTNHWVDYNTGSNPPIICAAQF